MSDPTITSANTVAQNLEIAQQDGTISPDEQRAIIAAASEHGVTNVEIRAARAWMESIVDTATTDIRATRPDLSDAEVRQLVRELLTERGVTGAVGNIERQLQQARDNQGVFSSMAAGWRSIFSPLNN